MILDWKDLVYTGTKWYRNDQLVDIWSMIEHKNLEIWSIDGVEFTEILKENFFIGVSDAPRHDIIWTENGNVIDCFKSKDIVFQRVQYLLNEAIKHICFQFM